MNEIKILPWVGYNQLQAVAFGLNHTQAIIMNYVVASLSLGGWADSKTFGDKVFYRAHSAKFLSDMPTLKISKTTLGHNVNELIKKGLLEREVVGRTVPYFRATEKWLYAANENGTEVVQNEGQYNIINQIKKEKNGKEIAEKLLDQLSSYLGEKKEHVNEFDLDNIEGGALVACLVRRLKEIESGDSDVILRSKYKIDEKYIKAIVTTITGLAEQYDRMELDLKGIPSKKFVGEMVTQMENLFDWYGREGRVIKDLKAAIRNWFDKKLRN